MKAEAAASMPIDSKGHSSPGVGPWTHIRESNRDPLRARDEAGKMGGRSSGGYLRPLRASTASVLAEGPEWGQSRRGVDTPDLLPRERLAFPTLPLFPGRARTWPHPSALLSPLRIEFPISSQEHRESYSERFHFLPDLLILKVVPPTGFEPVFAP